LVAAGLDPAIAFLVVAGAVLVVVAVLALVGKQTISRLRPPERTIRTSKETAAFLKKPRSTNAPSSQT
jgi:Putative Actinobacterial Holin-X, holin superfamily III